MKISNRFTIAVHMLAMISLGGDAVVTSARMAGSINTHPVIVRRISGMLKKAGLIDVRAGTGGAYLCRELSGISLLEVYKAVGVVEDMHLFNMHASPNPACPVGANITRALGGTLASAQQAMEAVLAATRVSDVVDSLVQAIRNRA